MGQPGSGRPAPPQTSATPSTCPSPARALLHSSSASWPFAEIPTRTAQHYNLLLASQIRRQRGELSTARGIPCISVLRFIGSRGSGPRNKMRPISHTHTHTLVSLAASSRVRAAAALRTSARGLCKLQGVLVNHQDSGQRPSRPHERHSGAAGALGRRAHAQPIGGAGENNQQNWTWGALDARAVRGSRV